MTLAKLSSRNRISGAIIYLLLGHRQRRCLSVSYPLRYPSTFGPRRNRMSTTSAPYHIHSSTGGLLDGWLRKTGCAPNPSHQVRAGYGCTEPMHIFQLGHFYRSEARVGQRLRNGTAHILGRLYWNICCATFSPSSSGYLTAGCGQKIPRYDSRESQDCKRRGSSRKSPSFSSPPLSSRPVT